MPETFAIIEVAMYVNYYKNQTREFKYTAQQKLSTDLNMLSHFE